MDLASRPGEGGARPRVRLRAVMGWSLALMGVLLARWWMTSVYVTFNVPGGRPLTQGWRELFNLTLLSSWLAWVPLLPGVAWAALRFRTASCGPWGLVLRHLLVALLLVTPHILSSALSWRLLVMKAPKSFPLSSHISGTLGDPWLRIQWIPSTLIEYVLMAGLVHVVEERRTLRETARRRRRLEGQLAQAELASLKMQLHPHFLFNALNALSTLVKRNPAEAVRMTGHLERLLRRALEESDLHEVPLARELEMLEAYLRVEQIRFDGHLDARLEAAPGTADALVPHFILQPLVENAVRHGLGPKPSPGWILIRADAVGDRLRLAVEDDGVGPGSGTGGTGIGLANTRARLEQAYGPEAAMAYGPRPGGGFRVELELPLRRA